MFLVPKEAITPLYTPDLTTLESVKGERGITGTTDDAQLTQNLHRASQWFAERADRVFVPYVAALSFDAPYSRGGGYSRALALDGEDVLAVTGVVNGDGTAVTAGQYVLRPYNRSPKDELELLPSSGVAWTFSNDPQRALSVEGTLGYHENYARAFKTQAALTAAINASMTLVPVSVGSAFETFGYLRVDGELMQTTSIVAATSPGTLQVERAVQGSAAASHALSASVEVYQQNALVVDAVNLLALHFYDNRDGYAAQLIDSTQTVADIPKRVTAAADRLMKRVFSI